MSSGDQPIPFLPDETIAERLRGVASQLSERAPAAAAEMLELAYVLDPSGAEDPRPASAPPPVADGRLPGL